MSWITICLSCSDCGGEISFLITENKPTENEAGTVRDALGGMSCINTYTKEMQEGINVIENQ